jgi:hypothetical protein
MQIVIDQLVVGFLLKLMMVYNLEMLCRWQVSSVVEASYTVY